MASPKKPQPSYDYVAFQQEQQDSPFPGTALKNDFIEFKRAADETIDALADIRRSDGALKNGIVTKDSLGPDVTLHGLEFGMNPATYDPQDLKADAFDRANHTGTETIADDELFVVDSADATKKLAFQVSSITTGTTRTVTWPDANVSFGTTGLALLAAETDADADAAVPDAPFVLRTRDHLSFREFAPTPDDDQVDNATKLETWLQSASDDGIPAVGYPGTFYVGEADFELQGNLQWRGVPGFSIKGLSGFSSTVVRIDGTSANRFELRTDGVTIDNSLRDFATAEASGTAMSIIRLGRYYIGNSAFVSTDDYENGGDPKGDSGISVNTCGPGHYYKSYFRGQPDLGIYITGGANDGSESDDWGDDIIESCVFDRCNTAASAKRQSRRFRLIGNNVDQCLLGFRRTEAGQEGVNFVGPGRELIAIGNTGVKIGGRFIDCRAGFGGDIVMGNHLVDWGYELDGSTPVGAPRAFNFQGVRGATVIGNTAKLEDWSKASQVGIYLADITLDSVAHDCEGNIVDGNTIRDAATGIQEVTGTGNYGANMMDNVTTPVVYAGGSTSRFGVLHPDGSGFADHRRLSVNKQGSFNSLTGTGVSIDSTGEIRAIADQATALRLNRTTDHGVIAQFFKDGSSVGSIQSNADVNLYFDGSIRLPSFSVATAPNAANHPRKLIYVTDGAAGAAVVAYSDGTNWRRTDDGNIISDS